MTHIIFIISLSSICILFLLCLPSLVSNKYRFFPPPAIGTWQYYLFWALFRIFIIGLLAVSILDFDSLNIGQDFLFGLPLLIGGIGSACYLSYITLGVTNSYGGKTGLRKESVYRWSRNPIYVVTFIGMLGWGLLANSLLTWVLLGLWATMYLFAPFIEEPWLEQEYGTDFIERNWGQMKVFTIKLK